MLETIDYLRTILETDGIIVSKLGNYHGYPSVAYQVAPDDMPFPYMVLNVIPATDTNPSLDRFVYTVDIYTDNGDIETAVILADRVDKLLDKRRLPPDIGVGVWRESKHPVTNETDVRIQHFHVSFVVRYNRIF